MTFFEHFFLCLPFVLGAGLAQGQEFGAAPVADTYARSSFYIDGGSSRSDGDFENDVALIRSVSCTSWLIEANPRW